VDGGAFHGAASRDLLARFPDAEVHAFEPQPELFARLTGEAKGHPRWRVHPFALSDAEGEATFHTPAGQTEAASLLAPGAGFNPAEKYPVRVITLAAWAASAGLKPDVLKLDLQGGEGLALRGAAPILAGVRAVLVEVNFTSRYEGCALFGGVAHLLEDAGFRLYDIHSDRAGRWQLADALYVRP
jgi:FkbM family methyltransferase